MLDDSKHDQRVLFQTVDRLLHTKSDPLYPTSSSDNDLAHKFADFFTEKITSLRNSLDSSSSTLVHLEDSSHASCVLSHFKNVTEAQESRLITSSTVKPCPLDPAAGVVLKECWSVLLPVMTNIVNLSINTAVMPDCFKVHLTSKIFFAKIKKLILRSNLVQKCFDLVKCSNIYASLKYVQMPPFSFTTKFMGHGSSAGCDVKSRTR